MDLFYDIPKEMFFEISFSFSLVPGLLFFYQQRFKLSTKIIS